MAKVREPAVVVTRPNGCLLEQPTNGDLCGTLRRLATIVPPDATWTGQSPPDDTEETTHGPDHPTA